ncbi:MAG TPA: outer membrane beta-barrel protein, partial [Flavobacterium sp.]|nr:outer membrane beta-barrel protein [Flavobacterium sp.]
MKNSFVLLLLISSFASAQDEVLKVSFSGYIDTYYSYDFNQPSLEQKLPFMYNYNRQNEFNLNIGLLRAKVDYQNAYAVLSLQSGTYVDDNYANEKMKNLNEAYVGLFLDQQKKHSVEVGILPSYIGFETAVSHTNLTLTRSLLAENSPYFMTGIKYNYKPSDKWSFSGFVTNGWQRIQKPEKDISPAFGTQISYKSSSNSVVNWSTFIGKEFNGMDYTMRY